MIEKQAARKEMSMGQDEHGEFTLFTVKSLKFGASHSSSFGDYFVQSISRLLVFRVSFFISIRV